MTLFFLALPSPEAAIARVAERVRHGGHAIPEEVIRRRFEAGFVLFNQEYKGRVNRWMLLDTTGPDPTPVDWADNP